MVVGDIKGLSYEVSNRNMHNKTLYLTLDVKQPF